MRHKNLFGVLCRFFSSSFSPSGFYNRCLGKDIITTNNKRKCNTFKENKYTVDLATRGRYNSLVSSSQVLENTHDLVEGVDTVPTTLLLPEIKKFFSSVYSCVSSSSSFVFKLAP